MRKKSLKIIISLGILALLILLLISYLNSKSLDAKLAREEKESYEKYLAIKEKIYLTGKFDPALRNDFASIPTKYALTSNKIYLRKETLDAFLKMQEAALKDEITLQIASATRNFKYQKDLWEKKWNGVTLVEGKNLSKTIPDGEKRFEKILEYSAAPSTSRHHWGTDIDINGASPEYFNSTKGKAEYDWLVKNAPLFGFCQTYNKKGENGRVSGYKEERWHWSYLPLARNFTQEYKNLVKEEDIKGFLGEEYAPNLNLIDDYVLSINSACI